jgi:hypothetical protein
VLPGPDGWRCASCGCSWAAAWRARERRGLPLLHFGAVTCSPECATKRDLWRRNARTEARAAATPKGAAWRCAICGCDRETMRARRKRLGLGPAPKAKTCGPQCSAKRDEVVRRERARRIHGG